MERSVLFVGSIPNADAVAACLADAGFEVLRDSTEARREPRIAEEGPSVVLVPADRVAGLDGALRSVPAVVFLVPEGFPTAQRDAAPDRIAVPASSTPEHLSASVERVFHSRRMATELSLLRDAVDPSWAPTSMGVSPALIELDQRIKVLAASERTTVLLLGEGGVGKERLARLIHQLSPRRQGPFVTFECWSPNGGRRDVVTALCGSTAGRGISRSGRHIGYVERAEGGTLFVDEVTELPERAQEVVARLLASGTYRRRGCARDVRTGARVIASSSTDVTQARDTGRLRDDLYYQLSVVPLRIPPLRERTSEDRRVLLDDLLCLAARRMRSTGTAFADDALDKLIAYAWPGNIREMVNVLERALILAGGESTIHAHHLPIEIRGRRASDGARRVLTMTELEKLHIERTLRFNKGNRSATARDLGIARATLIKKIKDFALDV